MLLNSLFIYLDKLSKIWLLFLFYFCFFCIFFSNFCLLSSFYIFFLKQQNIIDTSFVITPQLLESLFFMNLEKHNNSIILNTFSSTIQTYYVNIQIVYLCFIICIIYIHILKAIQHIFADYLRDIEKISATVCFFIFFLISFSFLWNNLPLLQNSMLFCFSNFLTTWQFCLFMFIFNIIQLGYIYILVNKFKTNIIKFYIKNLSFIGIYFWVFYIAITYIYIYVCVYI